MPVYIDPQQDVFKYLMRNLLILILVASILSPLVAWAQSEPPVPRPRPDRDALLRQVQPEEGSALEALTNALEARTNPTAVPAVASGPPQPITLSAKISEEGALIPDGIMWRIFDARADESGDMALLAKSEDAVAVFNLPPSDYVVHVAYGRSQATETIRVEPGKTSQTVILNSGGLQLNAAISGEIPIPENDLTFEIFATGLDENDRVLVAQNISPGALVHLNAGVYHVVSKFGAVNAQVRADLRVEPGQLTDATLYHRARKVSFRLVSETGGEAIADVDWSVTDSGGITIYSSFGAFPFTILAEGDYSVIARRGENVYNRDFNISAGAAQEIEVLTTIY